MSGQVDELFQALPAGVRETALEARELVTSLAPDVVEKRHAGWRVVGYSYDGTRETSVCAIAPHEKHVDLQFYRGVELEDPGGLLRGGGNRSRHVELREPGDVRKPGVRALVKQSAELARPDD